MQKLAAVFFFCFWAGISFAQINGSLLIPLDSNYRITNGDTVDNYARIGLQKHIWVNIEVDSVFKPLKIPMKLINHSDTPLIIIQAYWGEPFIGSEYQKEPIFKNDSGYLAYTVLYSGAGYGYRFNKTALVKTNQGNFNVSFKGVMAIRRERR